VGASTSGTLRAWAGIAFYLAMNPYRNLLSPDRVITAQKIVRTRP